MKIRCYQQKKDYIIYEMFSENLMVMGKDVYSSNRQGEKIGKFITFGKSKSKDDLRLE